MKKNKLYIYKNYYKYKYRPIFIIIFIIMLINIFLYKLDQAMTPTVLSYSESEMKAQAIDIINSTISDIYDSQFKYNDVFTIEKDKFGGIQLIKADTLKLNKIASNVAIEAQKKIKVIGEVGVSVPLGYIFKNNVLARFGPKVRIKMIPKGTVETKYISEFESVGINQTRHKIYVEVNTIVKVITSTKSSEVEVKNIVPIAETIIVGKVPSTVIDLNLDKAAFKTSN